MRIRDARRIGSIERGDRDILISALLRKDRSWLLTHDGDELSADDEAVLRRWIDERGRGVPVAYVTGEKEFFGRVFFVDRSTLIPRPSTEALIEETLRCLDTGEQGSAVTEADAGIVIARNIWGPLADVDAIVDVGTGSGCIAISLVCERPTLHAFASDISNDALRIASKNIMRHCAKVELRSGYLLEPMSDITEPFLLVSNPPYVADESLLAADVLDHEPRSALMGGGEDGADLLRELVTQAKAHAFCRGVIIECLRSQASIVTASYSPLSPQ